MRKVPIITGVLAAAGIFVAALTVSGESRAQDGLAVGVQGAFTDWEASLSGDSEGASESGVGGGLVMRYTAPIGTGMFAGVQASWSFSESAEWKASAAGPVDVDGLIYDVSGTITGEIDWSADLLARVGSSLGGVDAYVAAGLAFASAEIGVTASGVPKGSSADDAESISVSDSGSYTGFKVAVGIDMPIAETLGTFIQAEYADYGDASYFGGVDIEFTTIAVRAGLLYRF